MSETVISVSHLKYKYPHTEKLAIDDVSFEIKKGEFIGIAGANGAGKSTLCQAFLGLVPHFYKGAYGGQVIVKGMEVKDTPISQLCGKIGLVFQNPFNQLSGAKDNVFEEIAFGLQNFGIPSDEMVQRVNKVLRLLDIEQYKDRNPFDLSGGQMQRVALASILVMEPEIIVLDEPTSQLDPQGSDEVFRAVETLASSGITVIMVEQKINKLADYCDRILLMHEGKMVDFDTPEHVFSNDALASYHMLPPVITRICKECGVVKPDGTYPVTIKEAMALKDHFPMEEIKKQWKSLYVKDLKQKEDVFTIQNLDFSYTKNVPVIQNLNLILDKTPTAIIGQNGAGKTTFVKLLKGLLKPSGGTILYGKEDISGKSVAMMASEVGYVFQNPDDQLFKYTVLDEVMFGPCNIGMSKEEAKKASIDALNLVGLDHMVKKNPYDLELSERKLVTIASVIAMDPQVIILDEPTIAQDDNGRKLLGNIIKWLGEHGKSVVAILHDMEFVAENFERVIVMCKGKVLADGTPREVFAQKEVLMQAKLEQPYQLQLYEKLCC